MCDARGLSAEIFPGPGHGNHPLVIISVLAVRTFLFARRIVRFPLRLRHFRPAGMKMEDARARTSMPTAASPRATRTVTAGQVGIGAGLRRGNRRWDGLANWFTSLRTGASSWTTGLLCSCAVRQCSVLMLCRTKLLWRGICRLGD